MAAALGSTDLRAIYQDTGFVVIKGAGHTILTRIDFSAPVWDPVASLLLSKASGLSV